MVFQKHDSVWFFLCVSVCLCALQGRLPENARIEQKDEMGCPWLLGSHALHSPGTSYLHSFNHLICITYGVWVLIAMRSWYHIWDFFLCKSSSIRRNYGTLSPCFRDCTVDKRYHQTSFLIILTQVKTLNFCESTFYNPWWAFRPGYLTTSSTTQTPPLSPHNRSTSAFSLHTAPWLLLQSQSPPLFFFSFRCNKPSIMFIFICISLYFIHVLFWCIAVVWNSLFPCGRSEPRCCHRARDTDEWCYFGLSTCSLAGVALMELDFYFHVLRRCWYSVSLNVTFSGASDWLVLCLQYGFLLASGAVGWRGAAAEREAPVSWAGTPGRRSHCSGSNPETVISLPDPFLPLASPASLSEQTAIIWQAFFRCLFGSFVWKNIQGKGPNFFFFL